LRALLTLLLNAEVYAPEPLGRRHLLVADGRVAWIGLEVPKLPRELGVSEADLGGRRLIPGFVDGHVHVTGGGGEAGPETRVPPLGVSRFTTGGVTTVVGLLGTDDVTRDTASLVATVLGLGAQGITAFCHTGGYHLPAVTLTGSVRGDIALVGPIIGVGEVAISDHRSSQPTLDELMKLAAEAHVGGLMSGKAGIAHLHVGDGPRGLELVRAALDIQEIPARVFNPTHVNRRRALFDEALVLAERGCTVDLTAFPVAEGEDAWPAGEALVRYLDAGLPPERVTMSSDAGGCLPVFDAEGRVASFDVGSADALAHTLKTLLCNGHALERVLPAFTANPARFLRLSGKGRVAPGADADFVVLTSTGEISDVMALGCWQVREGRAVRTGSFEGAPA
jgi:beta-aspartyl-dipeptidase (metallo-type)